MLHAAAHKHVPIMQAKPEETSTNNVAVNLVSIMGFSKCIAEMVVQAVVPKSSTKFMVVGFGNVIGSRESVIPLILKYIAEGEAVTVTHPEMTRCFMTIPKAVQLVIQAGAYGPGRSNMRTEYVLRQGCPIGEKPWLQGRW